MRACVVKPHHAGLFSLINNVITCKEIYDVVHVDWSQGCIYGDAWKHLFAETILPDGPHEILTGYPHQALTYKNAADYYVSNEPWRERYNAIWSTLGVREEITDMADIFAIRFASLDPVSVLVRSHEHAGEQVSNRSQELDEYAREIEKLQTRNLIVFVMAADWQTIEWFGDRFPVAFHPATKRLLTRHGDRHLKEPQTIEDAKQCLVEALIIARTRALIHPVSNIATGALYINPSLTSVFLP